MPETKNKVENISEANYKHFYTHGLPSQFIFKDSSGGEHC
jgi:hypothetical protein